MNAAGWTGPKERRVHGGRALYYTRNKPVGDFTTSKVVGVVKGKHKITYQSGAVKLWLATLDRGRWFVYILFDLKLKYLFWAFL